MAFQPECDEVELKKYVMMLF